MGEYSSRARAQRAAGGCEAAPRGIKLAPGATHRAAAPVIGREWTAGRSTRVVPRKATPSVSYWGGRLIFG